MNAPASHPFRARRVFASLALLMVGYCAGNLSNHRASRDAVEVVVSYSRWRQNTLSGRFDQNIRIDPVSTNQHFNAKSAEADHYEVLSNPSKEVHNISRLVRQYGVFVLVFQDGSAVSLERNKGELFVRSVHYPYFDPEHLSRLW